MILNDVVPQLTWRFPKVGGTPTSSIDGIFHEIDQAFLGDHPFQETPISFNHITLWSTFT